MSSSRVSCPNPQVIRGMFLLRKVTPDRIELLHRVNASTFLTQESTLDRLHTQTDVLRLASEALTEEARRRIALLQREHNCVQPINSLPTEVLTLVLLMAIPADEKYDLIHLRKLAAVETRWWDIIRSEPRFWTEIVFQHGPSLQATALKLRKSQSMPLNITVISQWQDAVAAQTDIESFMELLSGHTQRWRSWTGLSVHSLNHVVHTLNSAGSLAGLRTLYMSSSTGRTNLLLNIAQAPQIEDLYIDGIPTQWSPSTYAHLRSLTIRCLHMAPGTLYDILRNTEGLKVLQLEYISSEESHYTNPGRSLVLLKQLRLLRLAFLATPITLPLLRCISAPALRSFDVHHVDTDCLLFDQLLTPNSFVASTLHSIRQIGSPDATVNSTKNIFGIHLHDHDHGTLYSLEMEPTRGWRKNLVANVHRLPFTHLNLPLAFHIGDTWKLSQLEAILQGLSSIRSIHVDGSTFITVFPRLVKWICLPLHPKNVWLCPHLEEIRLPSEDFERRSAYLLKNLRARNEVAADTLQMPSVAVLSM